MVDSHKPQIQSDNVDRMLVRVLEEMLVQQPWRATLPVVIVDDATGALSTWAVERDLDIRLVQDSAHLATKQEQQFGPISHVLDQQALSGAGTVILRLARPLEALEEASWQIARWAAPEVLLLAGQLERHLNFSMNTTLAQYFDDVSASRGYFKSRALRAQQPKKLEGNHPPRIPRRNRTTILDTTIDLRAFGLTFGAARLDPGTRLLLETLHRYRDELDPETMTVIDLGCGNGSIATVLDKVFGMQKIIASDNSAAAVRSTTETLAANGISGVNVLHQNGLETVPDSSVDVVVLNPPFHSGTEITTDIAAMLFDEAQRVLRPGGVLWTVFNASRPYVPLLEKKVGPTIQRARDPRFIVMESQKV